MKTAIYLIDALRWNSIGEIEAVRWHFEKHPGKTVSIQTDIPIKEAIRISKSHSVYIFVKDGAGSTALIGKNRFGHETFVDAPSCPFNQMLKNLDQF